MTGTQTVSSFMRTTAINRILMMRARKRVIQGGTSAGKTYAIIPVLINRALATPRLKITVVAETIPAVKDGAVDIFKEVMFNTGRWIESQWIGNPMEYRFQNGSRIQFKAFDSEGKAKAAGKRDILFINEANHISFLIADALMIRSKETYIDFNPDNEFWAHTEVLTEENAELLILTYADNEAIPAETLEDMLIKRRKAFYNPALPYVESPKKGDKKHLFAEENIKSGYWANWWKVYGMGLVGSLQGVVFENWKQVDSIPPHATLLGSGLDFGYTNDPTTVIDVYEADGEIYLDERIYQTGLTNPDIARLCKSMGIGQRRGGLVYADSAEPKSITELKQLGLNVTEAEKGKDSINFGIQRMQERRINITKSSLNLIKEFRKYKWAVDKTGASLNVPIDAFNHAIDAVRYFFTTTKPKGRKLKARF